MYGRELLPEFVFPFRLRESRRGGRDLDYEAKGELFNKVQKAWWIQRYQDVLPKYLFEERSGSFWQHLSDFISAERDKLSPVQREAVINYRFPQHPMRKLASEVAFTYHELSLALLHITTEYEFTYGWHKEPQDILEDQRRLGVPEGRIRAAKGLAKQWWFNQLVVKT